ncbi:MAG: PKD domain-containing protein [Bacteroidota bacterium]
MRLRQLHHLSLGILFFFTTVIGLAQPVAEFDVFNNGSRTICAPNSLVATFEDLSTNTGPNPTYQWITPVGNSTLSMPTFVFSDPGCYDITLIIGNSFGNDTITKTCFIEVYPQPEPAFTASDTVGCVPLDVTFTDASIANSPGGNTDWLWILSNTFQSTQQNPSFTFTDVGDTISVFLEVTNSFGCIATEFFPNVVTPLEAPIADFVADTNAACEAPFQVNFSNLSVENGASNFGTIIYTWIFPGGVIAGGGSTFTGPTPPPVTYGADGQYDVTLILTGLQGCADTIVRPSYIGIGGVDADFNADQTTVCLGEEIIFTSTSSGGVTLTEWDFGETPGIDATGGIVTHTYSAPGTYDVTVFANNSECGDTLTRTAYITVLDVPVASFTQDRDIDCQPGNPFTFTDQSTGATSWSWDFGDNNTSNQQNPTHTYTGFGTFIVTLTATNSVGCTSTTTSTIEIAPPQINFSITPSEGCAPLDVAFADLTVSPVDSIISWEWNFGTGTAVPPTATIQNPTTQYTVPGSYDVTLIVITANGCTDTLRRSGAVRVGTPPISTFTFDPDTICVNDVVTFQADSVNSDWEYLWDFQYVDPGAHVLDLPNPTPTYPDTGLYSVSLVVSNNGCQDTTTIDDAVFVSPPEAGFEIDQTLICSLPATITFTDTSVGPADIYDWSVNGNVFASFGGQQAPGPFQIDTPGVYLFQQRIENSLTGCRDSAIVVVAAGNPQASFTYAPTRGCYPLEVTVNNTSQNFTSGLFSFINEQGGQSNFSFSDNIIIQDTGLYDIRLVVSDQFGCRDTSFVPDGLEVVGPFAQYEAVRNPACPGETITFTETSTTYETTIVNWSWDFGDGGASGSGQVDSNVYTAPGLYNAVLTVTDDEGCTDDITLPISITSPTADFVVADTSTCAGNPIPFNNNSNGIGNSYLWLFGDGDTSTATAPLHPYFPDDSLTGTFYDVTLIATDINGCSDTVTRDDYIFIEPFDAFFFSNDTLGVCPPHPVQLFDQSVGNIVLWDWNFDFGNPQSPIIAGVDSPSVGFVYQAPGLYSVFMVATHEDGCRDTALREDYIFVAGPNGTYDVFPDAICEGEEICISTEILGAVSAIVLYDDGGTAVFDTTTLTGGVDSITSCYTYQAPNTWALS